MLDSNEQAKGGFGAFAARERERREATTPIVAEQADGAPDAEPTAERLTPPSAAPTGRQPKRWH